MTKTQALNAFFSQFLESYEENSIYTGIKLTFPYLTYEVKIDGFTDEDLAVSFSTWYRSDSWKKANEMTETISKVITREGVRIKFDDGYILIRRGQPFATLMGDDSDDFIKRTMFNVYLRYYSNY